MKNEDWKLANSLDALNDMFYGGFGEISGNEEIHLRWKDFEKSRNDLGYELTKAWYIEKLKSPTLYNAELFREKLSALENGTGQTYFDIILEIIAEHPNIKLIKL